MYSVSFKTVMPWSPAIRTEPSWLISCNSPIFVLGYFVDYWLSVLLVFGLYQEKPLYYTMESVNEKASTGEMNIQYLVSHGPVELRRGCSSKKCHLHLYRDFLVVTNSRYVISSCFTDVKDCIFSSSYCTTNQNDFYPSVLTSVFVPIHSTLCCGPILSCAPVENPVKNLLEH